MIGPGVLTEYTIYRNGQGIMFPFASVISKHFLCYQKYRGELNKTLSDSNLFFLNIMKELAPIFNSGNYDRDNYKDLQCYRDEINLKHDLYKRQITNTLNNLSLFVELLQNTKPHFIDTEYYN